MCATPLWFGPPERALFGWFHAPDSSRARGGVVLCPPLGIEAICTYFSYRVLADRLAEGGLAVVRFDYDGTGDSVGDQTDPGRVAAWQRSVDDAIALLTGSGIRSIGLGGIRMGALLAADAATRTEGVRALALWDPCLSGQSFLREQTAFRLLSLGGDVAGDGSVEAPGLRFSADTVEALSRIDLLKIEDRMADRVLVLEDPDKPRSSRLGKRLGGVNVHWGSAVGQAALLDPPRQETPWESIDRVATWLATSFDGDEPVEVIVPESRAAIVGTDTSGEPITEQPVGLGPLGLFGMVTQSGTRAGPSMVFLNEGNTPHIGQSRMWVELARAWAGEGLRCIRVDLSGIGDSGVRPGQEPHVTRAPEAFDDVQDIARAVSPDDPTDVVLIGLCSGAYQALEAAVDFAPRGICMLNPILTFTPPESPADPRRHARQITRPSLVRLSRRPVTLLARRRHPQDPQRWIRSFEIANWPAALARRRPGTPEVTWRLIRRMFLRYPSASVLERAVRAGVDVLLVAGNDDLMPIALGAQPVMTKLAQRKELFNLVVIEGLDHAGLIVEQRRALMNAVTNHVLKRFGRPHDQPNSVPLLRATPTGWAT